MQEQLVNQSSELKQAYQHMKILAECYQEQKYMLQAKVELKAKDVITWIKYNRELKKLEIRESRLRKKMNYIKQNMPDLIKEEVDEEAEDLKKLFFG